MTTAEPDPEVSARDQLSSLQGLLVISMLMMESSDEQRIVHLAGTSVPALAQSGLHGVYLTDGGWQPVDDGPLDSEVHADLQVQFVVLGSAGGAVSIARQSWAWAYPLRSLEGDFGYLVVGAQGEPPQSAQFLLRVLAQQTGIAIANARMHARDAATAAELRNSNAALAETVAALERTRGIHDRLTRVAVEDEGQPGLARAIQELTGLTTVIEDRHGNVRASAGELPPRSKDVPRARREILRRAIAAGKPIRDRDRLLMVAGADEQTVGVLVLVDPEQRAGATEEIALEHGATVLLLELARLRSLEETELRIGRDLVEELLSGTADESALTRAQLQGYDLERPHRVVLVDPNADAVVAPGFFHAVRRAARDVGVGSLLVGRGRAVVVLADAEHSWDTLREAIVSQAGLGPGSVDLGVGGVCERPSEFPRSYREAQVALKLQRTIGAIPQIKSFDQLGIYSVLAEVEDTAGLERFAGDWLSTLLEYDAAHNAELVSSLACYLEHGANNASTATALSVHRNTLKYRLQRVQELSGHDLSDPDTLFNLQLAVRVLRMVGALRGDEP
jgi:DNA-binding PucR family transcriptional regulator